jgi:hypothetical protein
MTAGTSMKATLLPVLIGLSLVVATPARAADEESETYYTFNETFITNSTDDGSSPNERTYYVSDVYETDCYLPQDSKNGFKSRIEARHFTKHGFEYVETPSVWSHKKRQQALEDRDDRIAERKRNDWKVVRVSFSHECE